jgi:hypothetical protein
MYEIKAHYQTGDSFHTEETSDVLAPCWHDLTTAKEALRWLNEHHEYYRASNDRYHWNEADKKNLANIAKKPWYAEQDSTGYKWPEWWHHSLKLPLDDGTLMVTSIPYHGYFEHLHSLEIILAKEDTDGLKIEY